MLFCFSMWFYLVCRWSRIVLWLWVRIWFSLVCFCFRPSIFFFLFSGEQVSCCLLFHCPWTRFLFCFCVFLRIWASFFLFGGMMCLGWGSFVSCSALVLAFSVFLVCAGGISVVSATWAAGVSCVLFQDWFLGLCSVFISWSGVVRFSVFRTARAVSASFLAAGWCSVSSLGSPCCFWWCFWCS